MDDLEPSDVAMALNSVPLFREIQKLLLSSQGPVNWETAEQIARGLADARPGVPADEADAEQLSENYRIAEMRVSSMTGLEVVRAMDKVQTVDRKSWVPRALSSLRPSLEKLAARLGGQVDIRPVSPGLGGLVSGVAPLAFGVQFGMMIGALSRRIISQHDLVFLEEGNREVLVFPNIVELERAFELDPIQFRMWLMLNGSIRDLLTSNVRWLSERQRTLISDYIDAAQIDPQAIASKFSGGGSPEEVLRLLERPDQLIPLLQTDAQKSIALELTTLMTVIEGYVDHVLAETGRDLLPDFGRISESTSRRRAAPSSSERLYEALLGIDLKGEQYRAGTRFIEVIVPAGGLQALWSGPEYLPTAKELGEPSSWLDRVLFS